MHRSIAVRNPDLTNRIITGKLDYLDMLLFPVHLLLVWITTLFTGVRAERQMSGILIQHLHNRPHNP